MILHASNACVDQVGVKYSGDGACGLYHATFKNSLSFKWFILIFFYDFIWLFWTYLKELYEVSLNPGHYTDEQINEEVGGNGVCDVYYECCATKCHPSEIGPEEC